MEQKRNRKKEQGFHSTWLLMLKNVNSSKSNCLLQTNNSSLTPSKYRSIRGSKSEMQVLKIRQHFLVYKTCLIIPM